MHKRSNLPKMKRPTSCRRLMIRKRKRISRCYLKRSIIRSQKRRRRLKLRNRKIKRRNLRKRKKNLFKKKKFLSLKRKPQKRRNLQKRKPQKMTNLNLKKKRMLIPKKMKTSQNGSLENRKNNITCLK
jgi:hypothetical protein